MLKTEAHSNRACHTKTILLQLLYEKFPAEGRTETASPHSYRYGGHFAVDVWIWGCSWLGVQFSRFRGKTICVPRVFTEFQSIGKSANSWEIVQKTHFHLQSNEILQNWSKRKKAVECHVVSFLFILLIYGTEYLVELIRFREVLAGQHWTYFRYSSFVQTHTKRIRILATEF